MLIKRPERRGRVIACEVNAYFGIVYITPGKLENVTFLLHLKPSVHTKASRKQSFSKTLFKLEEFENAGFAFSEINMEPELFENYAITTLRIYSPEFASNPFRKWRVPDCDVFKFLWRSVNGRHLMRFESENFIFKLLWRNVNRALDDQAPSLLP